MFNRFWKGKEKQGANIETAQAPAAQDEWVPELLCALKYLQLIVLLSILKILLNSSTLIVHVTRTE